ncbi:MAG: site-specific integrase, partial [Chloroflexi bacterium]|nr:site-specific integrase [Chloroflexota bacterium]
MAQSATKPRRRANGEGSIYFIEGEGRWRGALTWTDDDGRQRRRAVTGKTQADVRRKLTGLRGELDKGSA